MERRGKLPAFLFVIFVFLQVEKNINSNGKSKKSGGEAADSSERKEERLSRCKFGRPDSACENNERHADNCCVGGH